MHIAGETLFAYQGVLVSIVTSNKTHIVVVPESGSDVYSIPYDEAIDAIHEHNS